MCSDIGSHLVIAGNDLANSIISAGSTGLKSNYTHYSKMSLDIELFTEITAYG